MVTETGTGKLGQLALPHYAQLGMVSLVDGSFFPSIAAVNPTLTIIANALRVGDHLLDRLK